MFSFKINNRLNVFSYYVIFFIPIFPVSGAYIGVEIPDTLLSELYSSYRDALDIGEGTVSFRRVFTDNKKYQIHIMKLNEVNGNKRHNLLIKEDNSTNPLIYIDNPVETKMPNAYLTFEEFKKELTDRVIRLREEFAVRMNMKNKTAANNSKAKSNVTKEETLMKLFLNDLIKGNKQTKSSVNSTETTKGLENLVHRAKTTVDEDTVTLKSHYVTQKLRSDIGNKTTKLTEPYPKETTSKTEDSIITESNTVTGGTVKTAIESPNVTIATESSIESEVTDISEKYKATNKYEVEVVTRGVTATPEKNMELKIVKPSKPLVWMEGEES